MKNLDLHEIVRKSVNTLLGLAKQKDLHLLNRVARGTYILGNPQLLIQLFTNLIGNALKFTPSGGGVFVELAKEEVDKWTITVRDTGIGIPEEDFSKLFKIGEKYTREGLNGERGTGLGLSICYEIVQKHKGSITVQSVYGTGTTFYIQFPRISFEAGKLILIVDNEPGVRVLHTKYIQRLCPSHKIVHASDGEEALNLARSLQPSLIISDHDMPNVNGYELLNQLKADLSTKNIPIIFVTGHDSHAVRETLKSLGVSEVIIKPVSQENLEVALSRIGVLKKCENENQYQPNTEQMNRSVLVS
jgi:CheY-like chemotaxis protein